MKANLYRIFLIGTLAILLAECNQVTVANAPETPTRTSLQTGVMPETQTMPAAPTQEDDMQTDPSLPIPAIPGLQSLIEKAKADLAQRLSIPVSEISTPEIKEVFWPDASLGCPQPGLTYAQVQTPGYLILFEAGGNRFEYHANIHNRVFYCENPTPPILETPATAHP